jgi:hypothetical protein
VEPFHMALCQRHMVEGRARIAWLGLVLPDVLP